MWSKALIIYFRFQYSILHVVPPQSVPQVLLETKDLTNEAGFVDVNKSTLQHVKYPNVFALGDCTNTPNSKTMAAIGNWQKLKTLKLYDWKFVSIFPIDNNGFLLIPASQVGVLHRNIKQFSQGKSLDSVYDGYASCPLVTGYDSCIMAEFDYDLLPKETFPFRQDIERYSMFVLKRDVMPLLYWHLMLNGRWNGPEPIRKFFSIFKRN